MSKAKELLLECKIKLGIKTDYKLAQAMKMHRGLISDFMNEKRIPDEYACVRMALILEKDPAEVIALVMADTEKNIVRQEFWRDFLQRVQQRGKLFTLGVVFLLSSHGDSANADNWCLASHNVYYVK